MLCDRCLCCVPSRLEPLTVYCHPRNSVSQYVTQFKSLYLPLLCPSLSHAHTHTHTHTHTLTHTQVAPPTARWPRHAHTTYPHERPPLLPHPHVTTLTLMQLMQPPALLHLPEPRWEVLNDLTNWHFSEVIIMLCVKERVL